jgi:hypothetical protein
LTVGAAETAQSDSARMGGPVRAEVCPERKEDLM